MFVFSPPGSTEGIFMHEHAPKPGDQPELDPTLIETRLLTEVDNLVRHLDWRGNVSAEVERDTKQNMAASLCEAAMPDAVSITHHKVEYHGKEGRRERVITWLGKTAVECAESGRRFHFSQAAHDRVTVEIAEAIDVQETLTAGVAKVFISPKMSRADAPEQVAKDENLHDDDSLRVSYAVTNDAGEVIARTMMSLLVRDIPLKAWVSMLKDPNNIFGKPFSIENEDSALSVMKLFAKLDLPEDKLPEGPVTLVAAVLPYIKDSEAYVSAQEQLLGFRKSQELYKEQAQQKAEEWFRFDLELARSLKLGKATYPIYQQIVIRQEEWDKESLGIINQHSIGNAQYRMTRELATVLERSIRLDVERRAAVRAKNERALKEVSLETRQQIADADKYLTTLRSAGVAPAEIYTAQANLARLVARQNIRTGGGCAGTTRSVFGSKPGELSGDSEGILDQDATETSDSSNEKSNWKWKKGVCQVKACPSRPGQTEVGPCSVCRHCQAEFDAGRDPTKQGFKAKIEKVVAKTKEGLTFAGVFAGERAKRKAKQVGGAVLELVSGDKNR